jgi:hypothetical protein
MLLLLLLPLPGRLNLSYMDLRCASYLQKRGNVDLRVDDQNACERLRLVSVVVESKWVPAACSIRPIAGDCIDVAEDEVRCNCKKDPEEINKVAPT